MTTMGFFLTSMIADIVHHSDKIGCILKIVRERECLGVCLCGNGEDKVTGREVDSCMRIASFLEHNYVLLF